MAALAKAETESGGSREVCAYWKEQITAYDEVFADWEKRAEMISSRYRDERNRAFEQGQRRLNTLWAGTEILTPAVYSQRPTPKIERRFLDRDPIGRVSAQILERVTTFELEDNGFHDAMKCAVKDFLLGGRGQVWVRYEPKFGMGVSLKAEAELDLSEEESDVLERDESPEGEKLEETGERLVAESIPVDYVHWKDFMVFPAHARTWNEVTGVGKRVYLSKDEVEERWGKEMARKIQPDTSLEKSRRRNVVIPSIMFDRTDRKRVIYEIWCKSTLKVYWISTGYDDVIDVKSDPLKLKGFFPCPPPLVSITTNDTVVPVAFYIEYQDQAIQIDELTQRIHMLGKCVKAVGTYDGSNRALKRLLDESTENELIPVNDWARHREKGGIEGSISFLPVRDMVEALQVLVELRAKIMEDLDRVTGIADVLRGTSDARETMGGQRLKQNAANTRLDKLRDDIAVFACDVIRIMSEIAARHFSNDSLIKASGILYEEEITLDDYESMKDLLEPRPEPMPAQASQAPRAPGVSGSPGGQPGAPPQVTPTAGGGAPGINPPMASGAPPGQFMGSPAAGQPPMAGPAPMPAGAPPGLPAGMAAPGAQPPPLLGARQPPAGLPPIAIKLQRIQKAIQLLRDDISRGYRITVETDSLIAGEVASERDSTIQFLAAVSKFLEQAQMIGSQNPEIVPLLGKLLQFGVRKFRTGRDVESAIDDFIDRMSKQAKHIAENPGARPPSPEQIKAQSEQQKAQAEIRKIELTAQLQQQSEQQRQQLEAQTAQRDLQIQQAEEQRETRIAELKYQMEMQTLQMRMQMEQQKLQMQMQMDSQRAQMEAAHETHRMGLEQQRREAEHQFTLRSVALKSRQLEQQPSGEARA